MSKTFRIKFIKIGDMIYISHLDLQRLLQRVFRRAKIKIEYSNGYNPHPKISYGNALALGIESYGEYLDIEIEDEDIKGDELLDRLNLALPNGIEFLKCVELEQGEKALAANIEFGDYIFVIENINKYSKEQVDKYIGELLQKEEINLEKLNKKKKLVQVDIRPLIKKLYLFDINQDEISIGALLATGSRQNLNTNIFIPLLLKYLNIDLDPLDVHIIRKDLYFYSNGRLVNPL